MEIKTSHSEDLTLHFSFTMAQPSRLEAKLVAARDGIHLIPILLIFFQIFFSFCPLIQAFEPQAALLGTRRLIQQET